jgi:hypothetical protein
MGGIRSFGVVVQGQGRYRRPPRPVFEVTDCDLKAAVSIFDSRNIKSEGNRLAFLRTAWLSCLVVTP